jgi:hypothetical protein
MVACQRISEEIRTMEQLEGDENPALYKFQITLWSG